MVPVELDSFYVRCFCGDNAWIVCDKVTTDSDSCSFGLFFFWSDGADHSREGDCVTFGNLMLANEFCGVGSFDSVSHALC